jgi:hypothetical protein
MRFSQGYKPSGVVRQPQPDISIAPTPTTSGYSINHSNSSASARRSRSEKQRALLMWCSGKRLWENRKWRKFFRQVSLKIGNSGAQQRLDPPLPTTVGFIAAVQARDERSCMAARVLLDALNRHRGKGGQQKVTVEHVDVHAGGQAVVGVVESPGGGDRSISEDRPHGGAE